MPFLPRAARRSPSLSPAALGGRRAWRRTIRRVEADHHHQTLALLRALRDAPVLRLASAPQGTLELTVPGWAITLVGVPASGCHAITAVGGHEAYIGDSGRYGPFWWLEVRSGGTAGGLPSRAVALGAPIRLLPQEDGPGDPKSDLPPSPADLVHPWLPPTDQVGEAPCGMGALRGEAERVG